MMRVPFLVPLKGIATYVQSVPFKTDAFVSVGAVCGQRAIIVVVAKFSILEGF